MLTSFTRLRLSPGPGNPRNSEGAFAQLADGRILFVYTRFTEGAQDHAAAYLAGRISSDDGQSWTEDDLTVVPNEGRQNVMSVSLLRLRSGELALFYLLKHAPTDCIPQMRLSRDEGRTWSPARPCVADAPGYYVLNNDRMVQLDEGRLIMPLALHHKPGWDAPDWQGTLICALSDDSGATWRRCASALRGQDSSGQRIAVQEPGVVALRDGRLMMYCRTDAGCQYISFSADRGEQWEPLRPSNMVSPRSPASIKRIPSTGDLLLVWNDHAEISDPELLARRTPLCTAISHDEGRTWEQVRTLEENPHGWYCYTAIAFVEGHALLAYCAGDRRENNGLAETVISRVPLEWLYGVL